MITVKYTVTNLTFTASMITFLRRGWISLVFWVNIKFDLWRWNSNIYTAIFKNVLYQYCVSYFWTIKMHWHWFSIIFDRTFSTNLKGKEKWRYPSFWFVLNVSTTIKKIQGVMTHICLLCLVFQIFGSPYPIFLGLMAFLKFIDMGSASIFFFLGTYAADSHKLF